MHGALASPRPLAWQLAGLAGWLLVTFAAAALGAAASSQAGSFYADLARPAWAPPGWLFGPVWGALYLAMGLAAWLVWRSRADWRAAVPALTVYLVQLAANALWTWLFFVWRQGGWAFAEVVLLAVLILLTIHRFRRHSAISALLLVPYLGWVLFAAALTWTTWQMNPAVLG